MYQILKKKLRKILFRFDHSTRYFSQGGEDAILRAIFNKKFKAGQTGFFVDVGAYHPYLHSNTYYFYAHGWTGINIDATPGSMVLFNKMRKRDVNLEIGIGVEEGPKTFYIFDDSSTINSFSKENIEDLKLTKYVKKEVIINVESLGNVLEKHSQLFEQIDFLNIDVEGWGHEVLTSNNWNKFKPSVIVIELETENLEDTLENKTTIFLENLGYKVISKNIILKNVASVFFVSKDLDY